VTTITEHKVCERDSGLFVRDCECPTCEEIRDEFRELHAAKANVYLSNRPEDEKDRRMLAIEGQIERHKEWL
jgi:uncharacterized C2H2 Zn-finger protein